MGFPLTSFLSSCLLEEVNGWKKKKLHVVPRVRGHVVSWEPEGRYQYSKLFHWEPKGRYRCTMPTAKVPFWFSMEYLWIVVMPFWLATDDVLIVWYDPCHFLEPFRVILNKKKILSLDIDKLLVSPRILLVNHIKIMLCQKWENAVKTWCFIKNQRNCSLYTTHKGQSIHKQFIPFQWWCTVYVITTAFCVWHTVSLWAEEFLWFW